MPAKKKSKTTAPKSKFKAIKKNTISRKRARKSTSSKRSLKRKAAPKKTAKRRTRTKPPSVSAARELQQEIRNRRVNASETRQSDFRGLSRAEEADSESVDELVEEGNIFEAGAVAGVEEADDSDEREVHTHEASEDDVPDEYLEKD
jgi:type II secretory pathway component HofQ